MNDSEFYYVDELFKKLGIYREGMSATEVVNELTYGDRVKYLSHNVTDMTPEHEKPLYNVDRKRINMGSFSGFSISHMCKISMCVTEYSSEVGLTGSVSYFTLVKDWVFDEPRRRVDVTVDFTKFAKDMNPIDFVMKSKVSTLAGILEACIKKVDPALLEGKNYAYLNFVFEEGNIKIAMSSHLALKLSKAMVLFQNKYKLFDFETAQSPAMNTYMWAYRIYTISNHAIGYYARDIQEDGISLQNLVADYKTNLNYRKKAVRRAVMEDLGIEINDIVLFSVAAMSEVCPSKLEPITLVGCKEDGTTIREESSMRVMDSDSFFVGKIINYNDDYLVIKVKHEILKNTNYTSIPIPWEILLPDISDVFIRPKDKKDRSFLYYMKKLNESEYLNPLFKVPVLLTGKICSTLERPIVPFVYNIK